MHKTTDDVNRAIESFLHALKIKGLPLDKVYLFGSQAKGAAGPESDIDLIIVSSAFSDMPLWKRWEVLGDALAEVLQPIEALSYSPEEFTAQKNRQASFLQHILQQPDTIEYQL